LGDPKLLSPTHRNFNLLKWYEYSHFNLDNKRYFIRKSVQNFLRYQEISFYYTNDRKRISNSHLINLKIDLFCWTVKEQSENISYFFCEMLEEWPQIMQISTITFSLLYKMKAVELQVNLAIDSWTPSQLTHPLHNSSLYKIEERRINTSRG
jgi:hypothetical protein